MHEEVLFSTSEGFKMSAKHIFGGIDWPIPLDLEWIGCFEGWKR